MSNGAISDLPMLNDMDADYSPQYVKLARILRAEIESGQYQYGTSYLLPTWRGNMRSPCGWLPRAGDARRQQIRLPSGQFRVLPVGLGNTIRGNLRQSGCDVVLVGKRNLST